MKGASSARPRPQREPPHPAMRLPTLTASPRLHGRLATAVNLLFWLATAAYTTGFSLISLDEYHAFLPHALDLGNMAQTFYNTVHGAPFTFQNMRAHVAMEAFGTTTRLSFHVEPIIPLLALCYLPYPHVETLLVLQTLAVASGAIPTRLLARRHLAHPLAEIAFPLAYLLDPALEAANLYEFHPVTFAAPLLLWAFAFADAEQYGRFACCAAAALGCKEELGLSVALIGLWIGLHHRRWPLAALVATLGIAWSITALKLVLPAFNHGDSAYWDRYAPPGYFGSVVTQADICRFWLHRPDLLWRTLTSAAKQSYLHRLFMPAGYLSLASPLTLLVALPGLALIMLSYEPHMTGGLAHYSAELVPTLIVAAILGTRQLTRRLAPILHRSPATLTAAASLYLLVAALTNQRANGFTPIAASFTYPAVTAHDSLLAQILSRIPPDAAVSAQDTLNAHLSDRARVYLFPDTDNGRVQYIALDATQSIGPLLRPCDLAVLVAGNSAACAGIPGHAAPTAPAPALLHSSAGPFWPPRTAFSCSAAASPDSPYTPPYHPNSSPSCALQPPHSRPAHLSPGWAPAWIS